MSPTGTNCTGCGIPLYHRRAWQRLTAHQRANSGGGRHQARGMCGNCYERWRVRGDTTRLRITEAELTYTGGWTRRGLIWTGVREAE